MRTPFLLTTLAIVLEGCAVAPPQVQPSADQFIDEKLAQSASAISLAQRQLQQTAPARPASVSTPPAPKVVSTPAVVPAKPVATGSASHQLPARATDVAATVSAAATAAPQSAKKLSADIRPVTIAPSKTFPPSSAAAVPAVVAAAVPAKPTAPVVIPKPVWEARVGESLRKAITRWCERAHYTLDWQAEDLDYPIQAPLQFTGSFEDAVIGIFHLYDHAERSFRVDGRIAQSRLIVSENTTSAKGATP